MGTAARKTDGRREEERRRGGGGRGRGEGLQGVAEGRKGKGVCAARGVIKKRRDDEEEGQKRERRDRSEGLRKAEGEKGNQKSPWFCEEKPLPSSPSPPGFLSATSSPLHLSLSNELLALSDSGREAPSLHQTGAPTA